MKWGRIILLFVLILILSTIVYFAVNSKIITGYGARYLCTCSFVYEQDEKQSIKNELDYFMIRNASFSVDKSKKSVTGTFFGFGKRTAYYIQGKGCVLDANADGIVSSNLNPTSSEAPIVKDSIHQQLFGRPIPKNNDLETVAAAFFTPKSKTSGIAIFKNGELVFEKYGKGYDESSLLLGWSVTKSVAGVLAGILVKDGKIDIEKPTPIPSWRNDERNRITWNDLLQMQSGLSWSENYNMMSPVTRLLYTQESMYDFAIDRGMEASPGKHWEYSSGTSNILSGLYKQMLNEQYSQFPYTRLFRPLGMHSAIIDTDESGMFVLSSFMHATLQDWSKFGLFIRNNGRWNGNQLVPINWIEYCATPASASKGEYGAQFWLNKGLKYPDLPANLLMCNGHRGQHIWYFPTEDILFVRFGLSNATLNLNTNVRKILDVLK